MAGLLRKILPVGRSMPNEEDDDGDNVQYSFAAEYSGPPVDYDIPRAVPVDVNQLPVAAVVASAYLLNDVTLPVIQPIVKSTSSNKKQKEPKLGSEPAFCSGANRLLNSSGISCKQLNEADNLGALDCADGENPSPKVGSFSSARLGSRNFDECKLPSSDGIESSYRLQLHDGCESSHGLSRSLKVSELPQDEKEDIRGNFQNYMDPTNCDSRETDLSSRSISSEIFSGKEDFIEEAPSHVRRPSAVTFCDPESNDVVQEESDLSEAAGSAPARQMAVRPGKKGTCYRCLKGSRFSEKEVCIVCGAKYCIACVLRAMGSMPEGRKCITCIGQRIDETKRKTLGRRSRMLKKLLSESDVKQKMNAEKFCRENQLPPELVCVNSQYLSPDELSILQNCANPPKNLKPGYYWYDKMSGYWGKEGQKPCEIISSQLHIGGHILRDASHGNTKILINNREITKSELLMLQFAGVKCEGATSLWVGDDGSYQEEGMNNVKGNIWQKPRVKLICAFLSLPTPPESIRTDGEENGVVPDNLQQKTLKKYLLVGNKNSGTSTVYKQAKIVYNVPFSEEERQSLKFMIQTNLYRYIGILLEGREQFEEETLIEKRRCSINQRGTSEDTAVQINEENTYSIGPRLKSFSDWLVDIMVSGNLESIFPAAAREYSPFVEEFWKDAAIQATYNRRSELGSLPRFATYFLERAVEIARTDYEPSELDILYAEGVTSSKGLSSMEFSYPTSDQDNCGSIGYEHDPSLRYQLIRVHPNVLGGNCKWVERFEDIDVVIFCVSLTDYDEVFEDKNGVLTNKMMASKQLFESIATRRTFEDKKFLLILNKFDLLEEKIEESPLTRCEWFHDFNPLISHGSHCCSSNSRSTNPSLAHRAFEYVAVKFKRLFNSLTDKKLFVSLVTGLEPDNVEEALKYAREILRWDEEELNWHNNELSSTSIEASSSA